VWHRAEDLRRFKGALMSRHMLRRLRWRPTPDTAIALTALALAAGGGGYALGAAGSSPTITACIDPANNQPAAIVTTGACAGGQTPISWNQTGPQGPEGPAGKDLTASAPSVISLPTALKRVKNARFVVRLELPGPGTYLLEGHVDWTRKSLTLDAPVKCEILRTQPSTVLDTLGLTLDRNGPYSGEIDENALTTVAKPVPSSGPVQAIPVPVLVTFQCSARRSPSSTGLNGRVTFRDWTFTATPVKVTSVPKPK
jgi:hypothetical protein